MRRRTLMFGLATLWLAAAVLVAYLDLRRAQGAAAAPDLFASPIHAGCYIAAPGDCRIHLDPITINVDDGNGDHLSTSRSLPMDR